MKAKFFEQFKAVNDAATTATAPDFWAAQFHGIHTIAFEANIANGNRFTGQFFLGRSFNDGGASAATKQQTGGVTFRITTNQQNFFTLLRHHVTEVGQREAFANAAFAVDGNDLCFLSDLRSRHRGGFNGRFSAQNIAHEIHGGYRRN